MIRLTRMTKRYLRDFCFRLGVFLLVGIIYLLRPRWLDFAQGGPGWPVRLLLWVAVFASMVVQLNHRSGLTTGCMKQYSTGCAPVESYDSQALCQAVKKQNRGAVKVAAVWLAVNLTLGVLHWLKRIALPTLVLLCAFFFLCDLICVLFFCPFQTFLMGNQCCVNCRIFAWGSWMIAAPLMCVAHWYAQSLFWTSALVFLCWEVRFRRHPERFWSGSNRMLRCANCKEQLCRYKVPRSPWVKGYS